MAKTPNNDVLSTHKRAEPASAPAPPAPSAAAYPKMLVHKASTADALQTKQVNSVEEEQEAGDDWTTLDKLKIETAPAEKTDE